MTITREQVADLQPGDVVRITGWYGVTIEGPVQESMGSLWLGQHCRVTSHAGEPAAWMHMDADDATLTVVSRAPSLYVNHPRTEPVPGDVVRQASSPVHSSAHTWHYLGGDAEIPARWWRFDDARIPFDMDAGLILLVDGETGQVVP